MKNLTIYNLFLEIRKGQKSTLIVKQLQGRKTLKTTRHKPAHIL